MKATVLIGVMSVAVAAPIGYNMVKGYQAQVRLIHTKITQEQATQQAQADVAAMLRQLERYRTQLPSEPNLSGLVADAVTLGEQAGLQLTTIEQEPPQAFQYFTRLAVTFKFTVSYHQLGTFLDLIERSDRFMRVERLLVNSSPSAQRGGAAAVEMTLSTVYFPPVLRGVGG